MVTVEREFLRTLPGRRPDSNGISMTFHLQTVPSGA